MPPWVTRFGPPFDSVKATKSSSKSQAGGKLAKSANVKTAGEVGGNSPDYALKRLKRDKPGLAAKVVSGELSPHEAAG
jgi:hypothetical protein